MQKFVSKIKNIQEFSVQKEKKQCKSILNQLADLQTQIKSCRERTNILKSNSVNRIRVSEISERAKESLFNPKDLCLYEDKILYPISIDTRIKGFQHEIQQSTKTIPYMEHFKHIKGDLISKFEVDQKWLQQKMLHVTTDQQKKKKKQVIKKDRNGNFLCLLYKKNHYQKVMKHNKFLAFKNKMEVNDIYQNINLVNSHISSFKDTLKSPMSWMPQKSIIKKKVKKLRPEEEYKQNIRKFKKQIVINEIKLRAVKNIKNTYKILDKNRLKDYYFKSFL